ncbi:MAG TPA: peptidylprolyl isomerase [Elusimicrobiales bacterium]|nr:peptidylprolyl isomerase [Elusimicrobiales bacterium]
MKITALLPAVLLLACACSKQADKVIARIGSEKITESSLQEKLGEISPEAQDYLSTKPGRRQFLDVLIHERLMLLAARKSRVASGKEYKSQVLQKQAEMETALTAYKDFMLTKMWVENMRDGELKVTEDEVRDYYQKYPDTVRLAHILMADKEAAENVYRKLKAGADFEKLAKENSLDRETVRLPPVMYGEFMPELEDMAFKMRVGETQGIVKTPLGFHIIKKLAQERMPEAQAVERVRKILEKKKFDAYLARFQEKIKVEVLDENYK